MTEATQEQNNRDISKVVGGSARTIYESAQAQVKSGELDPSLGLSRSNQFSAPFDYLFVQEGFNIRERLNEARIRMFAESYKAGKFVPALEVIPKEGRFQILDGHHRYYGAKIAIEEGALLARLDLVIFEGDEREAILRMMNAADSERLTALDKASGYLRLRRAGMTVEEIAEAPQPVGTPDQKDAPVGECACRNQRCRALRSYQGIAGDRDPERVRAHRQKSSSAPECSDPGLR